MRPTMRSALVATLLLVSACAHGRSSGPARALGPADYFPLAVGNQWVWEDQSPQLAAERRGALRVVRIVEREFGEMDLRVGAGDGRTLAWLAARGSVLSEEYRDDVVLLRVSLSPGDRARLRKSRNGLFTVAGK